MDKRSGVLFRSSGANICGANDFYAVDHPDPRIVDRMWSGVEGHLAAAIEELISGRIDAQSWVNTLVPFVSALLVRGPDFNDRFERRFVIRRMLPLLAHRPDNTNWARLMELQSLQASVLGARWLVLRTGVKRCQITNDLGFIPHLDRKFGTKGITIPLGLRHVLMVTPTLQRRKVAIAKGGMWLPQIEYGSIDDERHVALLQTVAAMAQCFIVGPDEESLKDCVVKQKSPTRVPEPAMLGFMPSMMARQYEQTYLRLLVELSKPPHADGA